VRAPTASVLTYTARAGARIHAHAKHTFGGLSSVGTLAHAACGSGVGAALVSSPLRSFSASSSALCSASTCTHTHAHAHAHAHAHTHTSSIHKKKRHNSSKTHLERIEFPLHLNFRFQRTFIDITCICSMQAIHHLASDVSRCVCDVTDAFTGICERTVL
jgi:hypothetical protein